MSRCVALPRTPDMAFHWWWLCFARECAGSVHGGGCGGWTSGRVAPRAGGGTGAGERAWVNGAAWVPGLGAGGGVLGGGASAPLYPLWDRLIEAITIAAPRGLVPAQAAALAARACIRAAQAAADPDL